jgi:hypothetical protein
MVSHTPTRPLQTVCRSATPQVGAFLLQGLTRASKPWATAVAHPDSDRSPGRRLRHPHQVLKRKAHVCQARKTQDRSSGASSVTIGSKEAPRHTSMSPRMSFIVTNSPRCPGQHASHWLSPQSPSLFSPPLATDHAWHLCVHRKIRYRNRNLVSLPRCHWPIPQLPCDVGCWLYLCAGCWRVEAAARKQSRANSV